MTGACGDRRLLAAMGRVALRHGQMDYCLKMVVKTLSGIPADEALVRTRRMTPFNLRKEVRRLACGCIGEGAALNGLDTILERAREATERRDDLMQRLWASEPGGEDNGPTPSVKSLETLADDLYAVAVELTRSRLSGVLGAPIGGNYED